MNELETSAADVEADRKVYARGRLLARVGLGLYGAGLAIAIAMSPWSQAKLIGWVVLSAIYGLQVATIVSLWSGSARFLAFFRVLVVIGIPFLLINLGKLTEIDPARLMVNLNWQIAAEFLRLMLGIVMTTYLVVVFLFFPSVRRFYARGTWSIPRTTAAPVESARDPY
ncbi:hypothetical protein BH09VER1_BH09VER1_48590 [soil metagenome]